jgi:hypothetical protein
MKIKLYWSKRNKDWTFFYPDLAGNHLAPVFLDMVKSPLPYGDPSKDLRTLLREKGYDPDTLQITCKKLTPPQP